MEITRKDANPGEITLIISGQLDFKVRKDFQAALQEAKAEAPTHIILDVSHVSFIDCAAVGILVRTKEELAQSEITLSLRATPGRVLDVLKLLNIEKILAVTSTN